MDNTTKFIPPSNGNLIVSHAYVAHVLELKLSAAQLRLLLAIIDETKGWNRKSIAKGHGYWAMRARINRKHVSRELTALEKCGEIKWTRGDFDSRSPGTIDLIDATNSGGMPHVHATNVGGIDATNVGGRDTTNVGGMNATKIGDSINTVNTDNNNTDNTTPSEQPDGKRVSKSKKPASKDVSESNVLAIYKAYPRQVARGAALKAIEKALKKISFAELLAKVQAYAEVRLCDEGHPQFTPYPATWFNNESWADETAEAAPAPGDPDYATWEADQMMREVRGMSDEKWAVKMKAEIQGQPAPAPENPAWPYSDPVSVWQGEFMKVYHCTLTLNDADKARIVKCAKGVTQRHFMKAVSLYMNQENPSRYILENRHPVIAFFKEYQLWIAEGKPENE